MCGLIAFAPVPGDPKNGIATVVALVKGQKMPKLSDIKKFVPKRVSPDVKVLSNAQIAQIMVRQEEVLLERSVVEASLVTLSGVRDFRKAVVESINRGIIEENSKIVELVRLYIGLSEENLTDCDFD